MTSPSPHITLIGAGIAGCAAAELLHRKGVRVTLMDKGRLPGGRLSTRQPDLDTQYDHGTPYFLAHDPVFKAQLNAMIDHDCAQLWYAQVRDEQREKEGLQTFYVGTPAMRDVATHLLRELPTRAQHYSTHATHMEQVGDQLIVHAQDMHSAPSDVVICSAPPLQSSALIAPFDAPLAARLDAIEMRPQWALMMKLHVPHADKFFDVALLDGPIEQIIRDHRKPTRDTTPDHWVCLASQAWTSEHLEVDKALAVTLMVDALHRQGFLDADCVIDEAHAHRWRYAHTTHAVEARYLRADHAPILLCGDWCAGGGVEHAYLSGRAAARAALAQLAHKT